MRSEKLKFDFDFDPDSHALNNLKYSALDEIASAAIKTKSNEFEYTNYIAIKYIWPVVPIGFLILGTIANILSIIVFTRKEMRKYSSFCYFAFLNATNLAVLYVTLIRVIMNYNFDLDIRKLNLFSCKIHVFLTYFLGHLSSLLLCLISLDRVVSVMFLHKAKELCTPRVAFFLTIMLVIFNFVLSSHFLVFDSGYHRPLNESLLNVTNSSNNRYEVMCETIPETFYDIVVQNSWKIIDMSMYAFIPFIIMLICSVIIIVRVAQQSKKFDKKTDRKRSSAAVPVIDTKQNGNLKKNTSVTGSNSMINTQHARNTNEGKFSSRTRNLALMLIPVNMLFLMFLAPVVLTMYLYDKLSEDELTLAIVEHLSYCNFTFNFFIYFTTSSKFREEFFKFLNECFLRFKQKPNRPNNFNFNSRNTSMFYSTVRVDKMANKSINPECLALVENNMQRHKSLVADQVNKTYSKL